ncbi:hypothetical protein LCGC14_1534330 [marine sediment metagenome]|uniref:Uncharacterized protein n=1 Tax=marine sediment metagenome TaxID=412755 RepID=A0A0F9LVT0_9ZZZZ
MNPTGSDVRWVTKVIEKLSQRLRFLETLPRPSSTVVDTFLELGDAPDAYGGYKGFAVVVNPLEDGLQFQPFGGVACVAFTCGPIGWRAVGPAAAGALEPRTLVHEAAFQLSAEGDNRGDYAVDLQQLQFNDTYVAAAPYSAILTNEENKIEDDCDYSVIGGTWNEIRDNSSQNFVYGYGNEVFTNSFGNTVLGGGHSLDDSNYNSVLGKNHDLDGAYNCFIFGEQNDAIQNVNDAPNNSVSGGLFNVLEGDIFACFQFGEDNKMYGLGSAPDEQVWESGQFGFRHYAQNVFTNWQFGQSTKSFLADADASGEYYNGRILNSGDYENDHPSDGTGEVGGFNQDSWFSQSDIITTWNAAWTTERFEFPIIQDSIWTFLIYVSATERGCANSHSWKIEGVVENDGGTTTLLASTVTNIYRDVATKECQVVADDANDRLAIQFRDTAGPDATWTNVQISMFTVEVGAEV